MTHRSNRLLPMLKSGDCLQFAASCVAGIVALTALSLTSMSPPASAAAATSVTKKKITAKRTTTTRRKSVAPSATATTTKLPTTTAPLPTVAPAPTTNAPAPSTTEATTTSATTTTIAPVDFDVIVPTPSQSVPAGSTATFIVIVAAKSPPVLPRAVTFIATGMPPGSNATLSPNPVSSGAEFRVNIGADVPPGTYTVRLVGSIGTVTKIANVVVTVTAALSTTSTTTTTTPGPTSSTIVVGAGSSTFAVSVSSDGSKLRSGGTVSYLVRIISAAGFTAPASLAVNGLPAGVSGGFSEMTLQGTATLFVSSTVAIVPGRYNFTLTATAASIAQVIPLVLIIE